MSRTAVALAALCLSVALVGCAEDEAALDPAAPSESVAPEADEPESSPPTETDTGTSVAADQPFELVEDEGTWAVGHGVRFRVPDGWSAYGEEFLGSAGDTYEWAAGLPEDTEPFPAGVQVSAGVPGKGGQVHSGIATAAEETAELADGYEFIERGEVSVDGALEARFLRFRRELQGTTAEQVSLFVQVDDQTTTTIRFIAPDGEWETMMREAYESVVVTG